MTTQTDLQGHWRRLWLRAPGIDDTTTAVHWLQVGALYADVRIPAFRPDLTGAKALCAVDDAGLSALAKAEGFAGAISLDGDVCTWHRRINWHGAPQGIDAGRIAWRDDGKMVETGIHAEYAELWERSLGQGRAQILQGAGMTAYLVSVDDRFVFGAASPDAPSSAPTLSALARGQRGPEVAAFFDSVFALGTWDGDTGVAQAATNPLIEGTAILTRAGGITWHATRFDGARRDVVFETLVERP